MQFLLERKAEVSTDEKIIGTYTAFALPAG